jgi:hypothetical protein
LDAAPRPRRQPLRPERTPQVTGEPKFEELRERAEIERMLNNKISHP